jgi:hypothetical protein
MSWFLKLLEKVGRKRVVLDRESNEPYLERYYLFLKDRKKFPFNIFLHKFLKSDPDDLHDHPWPYATLILKGGYYEWIPQFNSEGKKAGEIGVWRSPGHFRICSATSYHRIELDPDITCWTLFMPGPQKREWGFATRKGWVQHEQYIEGKTNGQ